MRTFYILLLGLLSGAAAWGAESGDTVVLVYNTQMPESKDVADHYAQRRQVPADHIIGLSLPTGETMSRREYQDQLQNPLLGFTQKLTEPKIRYAVLCYGVPLRIAEDPALIEPDEEKLPPALRRNGAAVDSELSLLLWPKPHLLAGPLSNPFFAATNSADSRGILFVARLDGPNAAIARALVDKAMEAETNGLWGRAYFDLQGVTNDFKKGDDWLRVGAETAIRYGFTTVVDTNAATFPASFPMSQIALYAGWYDGNVSGPFAQPHVEFMPGAFAYHLHSFSAHTLRSATQNWCGPLLADGATATMGCVDEPYLDGTPNMAVFFTRWLSGFSFGEAAYAAQRVLSWQTTVIGDPLYRPFGKNPQLQHEALLQRHSPLIEWSHALIVNRNLRLGTPPTELIRYLQGVDTTAHSAVLTEMMGDLYQTAGDPGMSMHSYEEALQLNPTPQQTVRLTLVLGDKLAASGREKQALALEDGFLKAHATYPGALALYQKMESLALKIGEKSQAKHYAREIKRLTTPAN